MITANAQGPSSSERRRGLLYGLLVGDALGAWSDDGAQVLGLLWAALGRATVEQLLAAAVQEREE